MKLRLGIRSILKYILALGILSDLQAQDPQFTQFFANPIYTNPAFAGSSTVARGVLNYRSQWPGIAGTFKTYSASYDEHFDAINGGIGVIVTSDEAGVGTLRTTSVSGIYAYQININKYLSVRASVQGGIQQKSIDFSKLQFFDQIVRQQGFVRPTMETPVNTNPTYANFAAGFIAYTERFYGGFAAHNITEPRQGFYASQHDQVPIRYTVHTGMIIPVSNQADQNKAVNVWPNVLYMQQSMFNQLNLGIYINRGPLIAGTYFRQNSVNSDAFIVLIGMRLPKLRIGVSYDATVSDARPGAKQSYEFSLAFELRKRDRKKSVKQIRCPDF
jgi:type IX secretion system PorP/SprF family membrane protein